MAAATALACAALAWASALALVGGDVGVGGARSARRAHAAAARLVRLADVIGATPFASWLLGRASLRGLCDAALARWPGALVVRERACGAFLVALSLASLACAVLSRSAVGLAVAPLGAVVGIPAWDAARRRREASRLAADMPGVFRTLAMALGSGETLSQAIEYVGVNGRGPAARAFADASLSLRCGATVEEALAALSARLDAPGVGLLVAALLIAQRTGSPLVSLLTRSATLVERAGEFERLLEVKTAQVRLSVRVVCLLPAVLVCALSLMSADFQRGLATPVGLACVFVAALADAAAVVIIRHIMGAVL